MGNLSGRFKWTFALVISSLLFIWHSTMAASAVIANSSIGIKSLTEDQVSQIFLGKMTTLPSGIKIVVADHQDGESIKDEFYGRVVGKTSSQLKAYWAKIIFTGEGLPPKMFFGDKSVRDFVSKTPGAIGYVNAESVDTSVKVLLEYR